MRMRVISSVAAVAVAGLALASTAAGPAHAASTGDGSYAVHPIFVKSSITPDAHGNALPSPAQCVAIYGVACNTPQSMRAAYDVPATVNGQPAGTGSTIVIVDAYGSPTAQSDLDTFSATMGIPSTTVHVYQPVGSVVWHSTALENDWAGETSLDVQWAHAIAPGATIDLVEAQTAKDQVMNNAVQWAVNNLHPDAVSMSYGSPEGDLASAGANNEQNNQAAKIFAAGAAKGVTFIASSGDANSDNNLGFENFAYPAADPNVTAVGGTNLFKNLTSSLPAETVWNDTDPAQCPFGCVDKSFGGTGGAPSLVTGKQGSDVAYDASVYTGVLVYQGFHAAKDNGFYFTGGTSAGSPQWAAIDAILVQASGHDLGNLRPSLASWASSGALNDVTVGDNTSPTFAGGYAAKTGWDAPTGYGTPDVGKLLGQVS